MTKIAFIGLGNMGSGMCANLVGAGHEVTAFDLNPDAVKQAEAKGAQPAALARRSAMDSFQGCRRGICHGSTLTDADGQP